MGSTLKNVKLRLRSVQVLFILLFQLYMVLGQESVPKKRIIIDPGHGGKDSGAIGVNGLREKDVVLNIAKEIDRLNKTFFNEQFEIYLTRYRDTLISLSDRTRLAQRLDADIFISLHCNHADNPQARGVEVYVAKTETDYLEASIYLSYLIQKGFRDRLGFRSRGVKFGDFLVLLNSEKGTATILLELGFLSQTDEVVYLSNEASHNAIAMVILQATLKFRGYERVEYGSGEAFGQGY